MNKVKFEFQKRILKCYEATPRFVLLRPPVPGELLLRPRSAMLSLHHHQQDSRIIKLHE